MEISKAVKQLGFFYAAKGNDRFWSNGTNLIGGSFSNSRKAFLTTPNGVREVIIHGNSRPCENFKQVLEECGVDHAEM